MDKIERKLWQDRTVEGRMVLLDYLTEQDQQDTDDGKRCRAELCLLTIYHRALSLPARKQANGRWVDSYYALPYLWLTMHPTSKVVTILLNTSTPNSNSGDMYINSYVVNRQCNNPKQIADKVKRELSTINFMINLPPNTRQSETDLSGRCTYKYLLEHLQSYVPGMLIEKPDSV